jgi:hypothetical protein
VSEAREALRKREGVPASEVGMIGRWMVGEPAPQSLLALAEWALCRGVQGVVWTALPPKWNDKEDMPSSAQVIEYLRSLRGDPREAAEEYVKRAPRQIDTDYRRDIEQNLAWPPVGDASHETA